MFCCGKATAGNHRLIIVIYRFTSTTYHLIKVVYELTAIKFYRKSNHRIPKFGLSLVNGFCEKFLLIDMKLFTHSRHNFSEGNIK